MSKEQVSTIHISTTVTLLGSDAKVLTSVTTTEETCPGQYGGDGNTTSTATKIHQVTKELGERISVQAIAGLKELDY